MASKEDANGGVAAPALEQHDNAALGQASSPPAASSLYCLEEVKLVFEKTDTGLPVIVNVSQGLDSACLLLRLLCVSFFIVSLI
jgi:hypothetical protein